MKLLFILFGLVRLHLILVPVFSKMNYLLTTNASLYQNWIDPEKDQYIGNFCFNVRANRDAFIMLASEPLRDIPDGSNIEINLGCCLQSQIILRFNGLPVLQTSVITPDVLNDKKFINYCINWSNGIYNLYRDGKSLLVYQRNDLVFPVKVIGFRKWFEGDAIWSYSSN